VHGWNFLGNSNGDNANSMRLERTRILAKLGPKYSEVDESILDSDEKVEYALYQKVMTEVDAERSSFEGYMSYMEMMPMIMAGVPAKVGEALGADYTMEDLEGWAPEDQEMQQMRGLAIAMKSGELTEESIAKQAKQIQGMLDTHHNVDFDGRAVIGDNPDDFTDVNYGNNDVEGPDALHGTHVGGIVGAIRGNNLGGDGVADNVLLMSLRAVPDGDEYDKDIVLAIHYAVDNGAMVINMSFGKGYSPHAKEVYDAFAYADSKGVLLVHAAGNDASNIDNGGNFPTSKYEWQTKRLDHILEIGSSTKMSKIKKEKGVKYGAKKMALPSSFSNYGKSNVDVFAPGSEIYNSVPQSEYQVLQGTSMASPMVAGVAAMLKSYFPARSMKEIKEVILASATSYEGSMQQMPGTRDDDTTKEKEDQIDFATLSITGSVVNVKSAVKMLLKMEKQGK
jgi:subtilisin family serine protease